jgi:branched-chain amino acid transport system permease protein
MTLSSQLLQFLFTGITIGGIYGLVAVGFNIIYNATGIVNFAQGEFVMLGGMCAVWLSGSQVGLPLYAAIPLAVGIVTLIGICWSGLRCGPCAGESIWRRSSLPSALRFSSREP